MSSIYFCIKLSEPHAWGDVVIRVIELQTEDHLALM